MQVRVLIDVDGVLADFNSMFVEVARDLTPTDELADFEARVIAAGEPDHEFTGRLGLDLDTSRRAWDIVAQPGFAAALSPFPDTVKVVKALRDAHIADIVFVTAPYMPRRKTAPYRPSRTWAADRYDWLCTHLWDDPKVVSTHEKYTVAGDIFIDDKLGNIEEWAKAWPNSETIYWTSKVGPDYLYQRVTQLYKAKQSLYERQFHGWGLGGTRGAR